MSSELATVNNRVEGLEAALIQGDLSKLTPQERSTYYLRVCESVGLNPLTKPFSYLSLGGKTVLYANRDCTDQLRKVNGVSIKIVSRETIEGVYVVTASAVDKDSRTDESTGAVTTKGLAGENLANAFMKAETKAKRRVTLSICGLGMLDETEVTTIPGAVMLDSDGQQPSHHHHDGAGKPQNQTGHNMGQVANQADELAKMKVAMIADIRSDMFINQKAFLHEHIKKAIGRLTKPDQDDVWAEWVKRRDSLIDPTKSRQMSDTLTNPLTFADKDSDYVDMLAMIETNKDKLTTADYKAAKTKVEEAKKAFGTTPQQAKPNPLTTNMTQAADDGY